MREYFIDTERVGFSRWAKDDTDLALSLWGDPEVARFISRPGGFSDDEVRARLSLEMENQRAFGVSYWPIFEKASGAFLGCCGLRPFPPDARVFEIGFHLSRDQWGKGYAVEAARAVIRYAFESLSVKKIVAGHHPDNTASEKILRRLDFRSIGNQLYAPTGLYHPSYELTGDQWRKMP